MSRYIDIVIIIIIIITNNNIVLVSIIMALCQVRVTGRRGVGPGAGVDQLTLHTLK